MLTDRRTQGRTDDGRRVITIAHPEHSSGELITYKGNDKHEDVVSVLHNTTSHIQCLYQISNSYVLHFLRNF